MRKTSFWLGFALFLAIVITTIAFTTTWFGSKPKSVKAVETFPVVPISKLELHEVDELRAALTDPVMRSQFDSWKSEHANNLHVTVGTLKFGLTTYEIKLFPDMISIRFGDSSRRGVSIEAEDYDFDGRVDAGRVIRKGKQTKVFNVFTSQGFEHRKFYQNFYDEHRAVVTTRLGL